MKPLDPARLMRLANAIFPDDGELALYNTFIELHSDALVAETLEGPDDVARGGDSELVAVLGFATVGSQTCRIRWAFHASSLDQRMEIDRVARANAVVLPDDYKVSVEQPPRCLAALAAIRATDGRHAYVLYRHPGISRVEALAIVAKMADPPQPPPPPPAGPAGSN